MLIDASEEKANQIAQVLRGLEGVKMVNLLEGPPDVIVMLEARSRQKLAELTNRAFASVDSITEGMQVLPVRTGQSM